MTSYTKSHKLRLESTPTLDLCKQPSSSALPPAHPIMTNRLLFVQFPLNGHRPPVPQLVPITQSVSGHSMMAEDGLKNTKLIQYLSSSSSLVYFKVC